MAVDDRHFVEAEAIDVVFVEEEAGVVDEELPHLGLPVRVHQAAGPSLVREIETAVVVAVRLPVVEPDALVVEPAAGVVVDDVEDHGDAVQMEQIDQRHQLLRLAIEIGGAKRRKPVPSEQPIRLIEVARKIRRRRIDRVVHLRRELVEAVVAERTQRREFLHRHELHGVDAERYEMVDLEENIEEASGA